MHQSWALGVVCELIERGRIRCTYEIILGFPVIVLLFDEIRVMLCFVVLTVKTPAIYAKEVSSLTLKSPKGSYRRDVQTEESSTNACEGPYNVAGILVLGMIGRGV